MRLKLERFHSGEEATLGTLFINGAFECFTCEDQHQEKEKIYGETRIPAGTYWLGLRKEGGFHGRYKRTFGDTHKGMIEVKSVPNFTHILFHIGNDDGDTAGCILVGQGARKTWNGGTVQTSRMAYLDMYRKIIAAFDRQEDIQLTIIDRDKHA